MFFFFKQKTAYEMRISDWSSDVCSSDLHGVAPVVEQWQRAGVLHQRPQPVEPVSGIPGQKRQRAGVGLVWLHAATIEQPHVRKRTEQRSPVCAGDAIFQFLAVADEDRDACTLLGDAVELIQSLLIPTEGQPGQELMPGAVARLTRNKPTISLLYNAPTT